MRPKGKSITKLSPFEIVGFEGDKNLRELSWNQAVLEAVQKEYGLKHGEAVIFRNRAQDRFRLVVNIFGIPNLILPPIDSADKCSLDLKIALFLRKFRTHSQQITAYLKTEVELSETRVQRRQHLAKKAIANRR